jgi:hypothetical protein
MYPVKGYTRIYRSLVAITLLGNNRSNNRIGQDISSSGSSCAGKHFLKSECMYGMYRTSIYIAYRFYVSHRCILISNKTDKIFIGQ